MRRAALRLCSEQGASAAEAVEDCLWNIQRGKMAGVLPRLNQLKAHAKPPQGVDYARALCFLHDSAKGDALSARQCLLEELRLNPYHPDAASLLHQINTVLRPALSPPKDIQREYPLFALLFDALLDSTMLSWPRLLHLYRATERLARDGHHGAEESGHIVECGTAGGGAAVLMAVVLAEADAVNRSQGSNSCTPRCVFAMDSFVGMPPPGAEDRRITPSTGSSPTTSEVKGRDDSATASWGEGTCRSTVAHVRRLAQNFAVDDRLVIIEGFFKESIPAKLLPRSDIQRDGIALLHVDADWYASTRTVLELLVPIMRCVGAEHSDGQVQHRLVQVDDYNYWRGCRLAVDEFLAKYDGKPPQVQTVDANAIFFEVTRSQ